MSTTNANQKNLPQLLQLPFNQHKKVNDQNQIAQVQKIARTQSH